MVLSSPTAKSPRTDPTGPVSSTDAESFPVSRLNAWTFHVRSPSGEPCAVRPAQAPLQIEPSTAAHETADGGAGTTQLAGKRATTIATKATTASTVIQIPRRTVRSAHVQYDCGVHDARAAGIIDGSRIHANAVLLPKARQPHDELVEGRLLQP